MSHHRPPIITRMSQIAGMMSQNPDRPPQGLSFKPLGIALNSNESSPTYSSIAAELHAMADELETLNQRSNTVFNRQSSNTGRESCRASSSAFDDLIQLSDALPEQTKSNKDNKKTHGRASNARGKSSKVRFSFVEDGSEEGAGGEEEDDGPNMHVLREPPPSPGSTSSNKSSSSSAVGKGQRRSNTRLTPKPREKAEYPELSLRPPNIHRARTRESSTSSPHDRGNSHRNSMGNRRNTRSESHSRSYTSQDPDEWHHSSPQQTPLVSSHSSSSVDVPQPYYNQARTSYPGVAPTIPPIQAQQAQFQPRQRQLKAHEALAPPLLGQSTIFQFGPSTVATASPSKQTLHADQCANESTSGRGSSQYSRARSRSRSCSRSGSHYRPTPASPPWQPPGSHSSLPPPPALSRNWNY